MNRRAFLDVFGRRPTLIRVGNNENPYGPGPAALEALNSASRRANRYPGALSDELLSGIAREHGVPIDHLLLSGGSGDLMRAAVYSFTSPSRALVTPRPTYEAPMRSAQHIGSPLIRVPLTPSLRFDLAALSARSVNAGLVYICSPNNPTATALPAAELSRMIEELIGKSPATRLLVDEAYFEYADLPGFDTMIPMAMTHPQVIVTRTFSKIHGMAGMRVGYAIAHPSTLATLRTRHSGSSVSAVSLAAATASLKERSHVDRMRVMNRSVRAFMVNSFSVAGYQVAPADANFIFVNIRRDARGFGEACYARGIQIGRAFPPMNQWVRIAVGTQDEMDVAIAVFKEVLSEPARQNRRSLV